MNVDVLDILYHTYTFNAREREDMLAVYILNNYQDVVYISHIFVHTHNCCKDEITTEF